ncbi:MAG TPA: hypothetical protein VMX57_08475 [Planctomycetota bacterium]|nr:hypothetical protein [Planctomycetota bacterium]
MRRERSRAYGCLAACAVLTVVLAAGCAKPPIIEKPVPELSKAEVLSRLNSQASDTAGLEAKLDVKVRTSQSGREDSTGGNLAAAWPDKLRIRGRHDLLDYAPFDIGSDGETWFVQMHLGEQNDLHTGATHVLDEKFDPGVPLRPSDVVVALGVGRLDEKPPYRELFLTRLPGTYLITEFVSNRSGRYIARRIWVDPDSMVITRVESFRPDAAIDMIAEMTFDPRSEARTVPVTARIRLIRKDQFQLDLKLRDRKTGPIDPARARRLFAVPTDEGAKVISHD